MLEKEDSATVPTISVLRGACGSELRERAVAANRPHIYISLREATSSHELYVAVMHSMFSYERLGTIGTLAQSLGVWWIILFDIVMGSATSHNRQVHFSAMLKQSKRALHHCSTKQQTRRPLVIIDHLDNALSYGAGPQHSPSIDVAESQAIRSMLLKLGAWSEALCFDERLADVCFCLSQPKRAMFLDFRADKTCVVYDPSRACDFENAFSTWSRR